MKERIKKLLVLLYLLAKRAAQFLLKKFEDKNFTAWYANPNHENLRFEYDLGENSVVFDVGGYKGQWASDIFSMYICQVFIFEPVREFATNIKKRFSNNTKIKVFDYGLGGKTRSEEITLSADGSSIFRETKGVRETVRVVDVMEFISGHKINKIDLMKINIEGGEYELLERLIEASFVKNINNIQVQFHNIDASSEPRMIKIQSALQKTHQPTYQYKFVWENWTRK
jgi:FkbM family methyltransferase